jgi:uncharacterized protein YqeY
MAIDPLTAALSTALRSAMRARDAEAVSALRTALAAVANAEAVDAGDGAVTRSAPGSEHVAGAALGVGAAETARRELSATDVRRIVEGEVRERLDAAADHGAADQPAYAERLRREAAALQEVLDATVDA